MKVLITGANGFIGKNLILKLKDLKQYEILTFVKGDSLKTLSDYLLIADVVFHLAGENRPHDERDFEHINFGLTQDICKILKKNGRKVPLIFSSSQQALDNNPYGRSKLKAEGVVRDLALINKNKVLIYRLPGVFGKLCKPNYNSVVATFCNNIAKGLPIKINAPHAILKLVYIDDVVESFLINLEQLPDENVANITVAPEYTITLKDLAIQIEAFNNCRVSLMSEKVGTGLTRALYATYLSYLAPKNFSYELPVHADERGIFVEMLKTSDSGQFSFFTAYPGITRGGHYHHTKNEKFLVVKGQARFKFRHMITQEVVTIDTSSELPSIVETIPGWAHDITNIGAEDMCVMLWANEVFDRDQPDTMAAEV